MKFVGLSQGEFKILEDVGPEQLEKLQADFAWIDIGRMDPKTELTVRKLYGIKSLSESGFPAIVQYGSYDLVLANYFAQQARQEIQVFLSDKFVITVHRGPDPVCDETMAAVNEMLVSGGFGSGTVLHSLLGRVLERHEERLRALQGSLRSLDLQMRKGISKVEYLSELSENSKELQRVFHDTRSQIADIVLGAVVVKGVKEPERFSDLYNRAGDISRRLDEFSAAVDRDMSDLTSSLWKQLGRVKGVALGISIFALSLAVAALAYLFFPEGLLDLEPLLLVLIIIALGAVGMIAAQRRMKFKRP